MTDTIIRGSGGSPSEAKDTLDSQGYLRVVDILCEGEIQGPATPEKNGISKSEARYTVEAYKDIFVDNTPVLRSSAVVKNGTYSQSGGTITVTCTAHGFLSGNEVRLIPTTGLATTDNYTVTSSTSNSFTCAAKNSNTTSGNLAVARPGDFNFTKFEVTTLYGTPTQSLPIGFNAVESEFSVGTKVEQNVPLVRTITNTSVNAVKITINIPVLQRVQGDGDIVGTTIDLAIDISENGGGFYTAIQDQINGRSADLYQKDYEVQLTGKSFPIDIRVRRITADSTSSKLNNEFTWNSYTEVVYARLSYPNTALVAGRFAAEQFSNIPDRSYRIRGRKVQIPSNATVDLATGRLIYAGVWNGTFQAAQWTTDPAWCMWNLLTDYRAGFGDQLDASVLDKWAFYAASQYASGLVKTGFKNNLNQDIYEPRFSCNVLIQTREEAYKLITDLASVFRVMPYWSAGALTVSPDKPTDPIYLFNKSNVTEEGFNYQGSSQKVKPTVVVVAYLDLDTRELAYEQVEDTDGIAKYGVISTEISAFACTSRSQANRIGRWVLYTEKYEGETVTFTASVEAGVVVRPGCVIAVSDPMRAGSRQGGRVISATSSSIVVDSATNLASGSSQTISIILSDGTFETRGITTIVGNTVNVSVAFSKVPAPGSVWIIENSTVETSLWRVLGVTEEDQINYKIVGLKYDPSKYAYIEEGLPLEPRDTTNLTLVVDPPTNLSYVEALYTYQAEVRSKIVLSWPAVEDVPEYKVRWRKDSNNWSQAIAASPGYEILDTTPGTFNIEVYSLNSAGKASTTAAKLTLVALGKTAPPEDVTGFTAALDPEVGITLSWNPVSDLDIQGYEIWQGPAWNSGTKLGLFSATSKKLGLITAATTQWWIKALDTSGTYSLNATEATSTLSVPPAPPVSGAFSGENYMLNWTAVAGSLATDFYEIRIGAPASTWATATVVATVKGTGFMFKVNWVGIKRVFVAAVDIVGNYGAAGFTDADVIEPTQPSISQQVIDNNVLLRWNDCTQTLPLITYELRKGATWAGATVIGTKSGRFTTVFETESGVYTYWLAGIDSAGNYGTPGNVVASVSQPPDYILRSNIDSTFSGTKVNTFVENTDLIACVNTTETWQSHFTSRSWTTPQDQIDAGYTYYLMPSETTGVYTEEIDYGTVLASTKITVTPNAANIAGTTTATPLIRARGITSTAATYSQTGTTITVTSTAHGLLAGDFVYHDFTSGTATDGNYTVATASTNSYTITSATSTTTSGNVNWIEWNSYPSTTSVYVSNFRYVIVQYDFASSGGNDLYVMYDLNIKLDSKLKTDAGTASANSGDTGGTTVSFNVSFTDIESITVTPLTTSPVIAVYDFVDVPNPTTFKVLLFDTTGTRVSGTFSWSARGV